MVAPHDRLLHDLVLRSMPSLVDLAEERGGFVPRHVVRYLDRYGHCGEPEQGFALLRCSCGAAKVVPFRCHGRALCPTCGGRAMASGAAHLVDSMLPDVTVRQWVLSGPWPRRYLFAARPELCAGVRRRVWRQLSRWYTLRARALGQPAGATGAVVVVQRFGSALNLNVHFHMLLLDGGFVDDPDTVRWVKVPAPTTQEVQQLVTDLARTIETWPDTQGYGSDDPCDEDQDDEANGALLAASVAGRTALGTRAGLLLHAIVQPPATLGVLHSLRRSANRNARAPPMAS